MKNGSAIIAKNRSNILLKVSLYILKPLNYPDPVSYTHLDVYKRQGTNKSISHPNAAISSYKFVDKYKLAAISGS